MSSKASGGGSKLVTVGPVIIPEAPEMATPVQGKVEDVDGEVRQVVQPDTQDQAVPVAQLFSQAAADVGHAVCGTDPGVGPGADGGAGGTVAPGSTGTPPVTGAGPGTTTDPGSLSGISPKFVRGARVLTQFILMFIKTPTNIRMLNHPNNADT